MYCMAWHRSIFVLLFYNKIYITKYIANINNITKYITNIYNYNKIYNKY